MTYLIKKVKKNQLQPLSFPEQKLQGLKRRCPDVGREAYILAVEKKWEAYAFDRANENLMNDLLKALDYKIKMIAKSWGKDWGGKRLSVADFESVFYEAAFKLCDSYQWHSEFYFYETLLRDLKSRAIDLTRKIKTKQGSFEVNTNSLTEETVDTLADSSVNVEQEVLTCDLVTQILNNDALSLQEKQLLQVIYSNPDGSYSEWAEAIGLKHHEQAKRMLRKINRKLSPLFYN